MPAYDGAWPRDSAFYSILASEWPTVRRAPAGEAGHPRRPRRGALGSNLCSCSASTRGCRGAATRPSTPSAPQPRVHGTRRAHHPTRPTRSRSASPSCGGELARLIAELAPDVVVVEHVFFQVNVRTAMSVGQASGLALAEAASAGCEVVQYTPNQVKEAVVGYGAATKAQVQRLVQARLEAWPHRPARPTRPTRLRSRSAISRGRRGERGSSAHDRLAAMIGSLPAASVARAFARGRGARRGRRRRLSRHRSRPARSGSWVIPVREVFLYIHDHVREDAHTLYGFLARDERSCFEALLGAHGVGPALALAIFAVHAPPTCAARRRCRRRRRAVPGARRRQEDRGAAAHRLEDAARGARPRPHCGERFDRRACEHVSGRRRPRRAHWPRLRPRRSARGDARPRTPATTRPRCCAKRCSASRRCAAMREELLEPAPDPADARARSQPAAPLARRVRRPERAEGSPRHHPRGRSAPRPGRRPPPLRRPARARQDHARRDRRRTSSASRLHITSGPALERAGDLAAILTKLDEGDVLFIDEIHRLGAPRRGDPLSRDGGLPARHRRRQGPCGQLDPPRASRASRWSERRRVRVSSPGRSAIVSASSPASTSTRATSSSRSCCAPPRSSAYPSTRRAQARSRGVRAARLASRTDCSGVSATSPRCGATARSTSESRPTALRCSASIDLGLDKVDRAILRAICERFGGGPVGLSTLAISVGEQPETVEDVYEPFLMQQGLLQRTPRGRVASAAAFAHIGLEPPVVERAAGLFDG